MVSLHGKKKIKAKHSWYKSVLGIFASFILVLLLVALVVRIQTSPVFNRSGASSQTLITGEKWIHPNLHQDLGTYFWTASSLKGSGWDTILPSVDVVSWFMLTVKDNPGGFLKSAIERINFYSKKIAVETFGSWKYSPCNSLRGEDSARVELGYIKPIYDNGGTVYYLSMDDPISRMIRGSKNQAGTCNFSMEDSVREMIDYMKAVHRQYPNIKIGVIFNFPNWPYPDGESSQLATYFEGYNTSLPSLKNVIDYMTGEVTKSGEKLAFIHADNPYDYYLGQAPTPYVQSKITNWSNRLLLLEKQVKQKNIPFGVIYNSQRGGDYSSGLYFSDTIDYLNQYQTFGGRPEHTILESWYKNPKVFLPTSEVCSFGSLALAAFSSSNKTNCTYNTSENQVVKKPVYRINTPNSYFYIQSDLATAQSWANSHNGIVEGVAFNAIDKHPLADVVYSLKNSNNNYLFSSSRSELKQAIEKYGYSPNDIAFYVLNKSIQGAQPVYRLNNKGRYLLTISEQEKNQAVASYGYTYEGVAFFAFP